MTDAAKESLAPDVYRLAQMGIPTAKSARVWPSLSFPFAFRKLHPSSAGDWWNLAGPAVTLVAVIGEMVAIQLQSTPVALWTLIFFSLTFGAIAWTRYSAALTGLAFALPLITIEVGFGDVDKTISTDKVVLIAVVIVWLIRRASAIPSLLRVSVVKPWLVFLAVCVMSVVVNGPSLDQAWNLLKLAVLFGVFLLALDAFQDVRVLRSTLAMAVAAGLVIAVLAFAQSALWTAGTLAVFYFKHGTMLDQAPLGATLGHPNFLGGYFVLLLPLPLMTAFWVSARRAAWLTAVGGVIGIGLVSAWAIGSWIGLAAAALLMAGLSAAGAVRPRVLAILCLTFVLVIALGGAIGFKKIHRSMNSINVRTVSARIGLAAVAERPVFGFGAGGFAREYRRLERDVFGEHLTRRRFTVDRLSAHNAYLDIAVERGMFGLAAFVGIVAALLALGVRAALRIKDVERRALLIALVAGLTGFAVDSFTDNLFSFSKVSAIFWILGAALVRLAAEPSANAETPPSSP